VHFDIAFALRFAASSIARPNEVEARTAARQIAEHLELYGWTLVKRRPAPVATRHTHIATLHDQTGAGRRNSPS